MSVCPTYEISDVSSTKETEIDGNATNSLSPNHSVNGRGNGPDIFETKSCYILSQDYIYILCIYVSKEMLFFKMTAIDFPRAPLKV